ncbi:MAG: hypothetical protein SFY69_06210 [Planctomycetota bacterium]|nr:hypothetical protein [Planctomycetota bacterium]
MKPHALVVGSLLVALPGAPACAAGLPVPHEARADPAVKAGVEATMRGIEAAALAGDAPAYLAFIDKADSEFVYEQTYFANDMAKKKPTAVQLTVGELAVEGPNATGPLTWTWTMAEGKPRTVTFAARFVSQDGRWLYAGETWETHEAPGVVVYHDPGLDELAERTVEAFVAVRADVEKLFGHHEGDLPGHDLPRHTQKIKLYGSMRHLQHSICLSYTNGLAGWNEPNESIKLLASRRSSVPDLKALLAHEYGHVATFVMGPASNKMPWWALEGVAEYAMTTVLDGRTPERAVERWARRGQLAPWDAITDFETVEGRYQGHVYTQGHHMVQFITTRSGDGARNAWFRAMSGGKSLDEATREALGVSFEALDKEWRDSLPAPEKPEDAAPDEQPVGT